MDKLVINNIQLKTLIGIHPWEQQCRQALYLDLVVATDAAHIARYDSIENAINYDRLVQHLINFANQHHFQLLETLAEHLAQECLTHFATKWVQITLHKPGALSCAKDVAIIIERAKN